MGYQPYPDLVEVVRDSLYVVSNVYRRDRDGGLRYSGHRPGSGWHAHGYTGKTITFLEAGSVVQHVVLKRRWLLYTSTQTCHSRPPDDVRSSYFCTLILSLKLFSWLSTSGIHTSTEVIDSLEGVVSARTLQRLMTRLRPHAFEAEHAIRAALIERCEPRPFERLFPGGLSPPAALLRRQWQAPLAIGRLWRALTMALIGAAKLGMSPPILLAEARGRWNRR